MHQACSSRKNGNGRNYIRNQCPPVSATLLLHIVHEDSHGYKRLVDSHGYKGVRETKTTSWYQSLLKKDYRTV